MFQLAVLSWNVTKEIHSVWLKRLNKSNSMAILASGPFIDVIYYQGLIYARLWYLTAKVENLKGCDSLKTKPQVIWTHSKLPSACSSDKIYETASYWSPLMLLNVICLLADSTKPYSVVHNIIPSWKYTFCQML